MGAASYIQTNCLGGEWSKAMQGRVDRPDYRGALNVCLNSLPIETGAWTRRPGLQFAGTTRGGLAGRLIKFDFQEAAPYDLEFTDGHLRCWEGPALVTTNDSVGVASISTANPAVVQTAAAVTWASTDQAFFSAFGATSPLLQNRVFILTKVDTTHFSLADAVTGTAIDGATLAWAVTTGATINRVRDLATPYSSGIWSTLRSVQTETTTFLLNASVSPYALTVATLPTPVKFATFALAAANFKDGPYLDPVVGGTLATPSATIGNINLTLSFNAYDAARSYAIGDYVVSVNVNYKSLTDANIGHTPAISPTNWVAVRADDAIGPNGFLGTDVGRLVRMFSEPALWAVGTAYATGNVVSYNPSGLPGQTTYWTALGASTGKQPGLDTTNWTLTPQGAAIWTWGKITGLSTVIDRALAGSVNIGDMTALGGLAAAFDGNASQTQTQCASTPASAGGDPITAYIGKNYSGATAQAIASATITPSSDFGFTGLTDIAFGGQPLITVNLRAKATVPASGSDGTLLGSASARDSTASMTIFSSDAVTTWNYVWFEITYNINDAHGAVNCTQVAECQFFGPPGSGVASGVTVQVLGPALLYTTAIRTWRLGAYSTTTGWPTAGTYHEGRLWLTGALSNRIDASVSNGVVGGVVDFAPTNQFGAVVASNAISYVFNAPDANPIFWMEPDLQGIICGTQAGEWLVRAPTPGSLAPTNIAAHRVTKTKCANIEPRRTPHTVAFVQAYRRKIMEYFPDIASGKFTAPNLSETAKHLTKGFVDEIAYQDELAPVVWARVAGALVGCTYKRDTPSAQQKPTIAGWHRHTLGSARTIESLCVGPSVGGELDSVAMVTNDAVSGVRHVEIMTDLLDEGSALADAWLLDNAVVPSSTEVLGAYTNAPYGGLKLNGLWHLNGKTVTVFAGGLDCGDWLVASGSVTVSFGDSISGGTGSGLFTAAFVATGVRIIAGFTYTSDGQIVRPHAPAESGARNGPAFGKTRRNQKYAIEVDLTAGLSIGTDFASMRPVDFRSPSNVQMTALQTASGIYKGSLEDDYSLDGMVCWRVTRPLPATVIAIGAMIHTQDE